MSRRNHGNTQKFFSCVAVLSAYLCDFCVRFESILLREIVFCLAETAEIRRNSSVCVAGFFVSKILTPKNNLRRDTRKLLKIPYICTGKQRNLQNGSLFNMTDNEITYQIRGAIYEVYKNLGPGLLESVYEEAMVYELQKRGLKVERQKDVPILYDGHELQTQLRVDLLVEERVIVELKSVQEMKNVFWKQTLTYLRLLKLKVGILVNFNVNNILDDAIYRIVNNF